jgi:hypothetical protein
MDSREKIAGMTALKFARYALIHGIRNSHPMHCGAATAGL